MLLWMAKKIILENKLRSFVPLVGIIIGVASIMGILAISSGGEKAVKRDLASIAENRMLISSENGFTKEDLDLVENNPIVDYVFSPDMNVIGSYKNNLKKVKIEGYSKKAIDHKDLKVIGTLNLRNKDVVIGESLARDIFKTKDYNSLVGRSFEISLGNKSIEKYRVAGIYKEDLKDSLEAKSIYIDTSEYFKISNKSLRNLVIAYKDEESVKEGTEYIIQMLSRKNYQNRYVVLEGNAKYEKIQRIKEIINIFLTAVGSIALIMGGLGISNLLLNSVREMTPSIGILRAMGMSSKDILKVFLYQSLILSILGGIIGIILGVIGSYIIGELIKVPSIYYTHQIILVFVTSVGMGTLFGSIPAYKAGKLEVVKAMKV